MRKMWRRMRSKRSADYEEKDEREAEEELEETHRKPEPTSMKTTEQEEKVSEEEEEKEKHVDDDVAEHKTNPKQIDLDEDHQTLDEMKSTEIQAETETSSEEKEEEKEEEEEQVEIVETSRRSSWMDAAFASRVAAEQRRKSTMLSEGDLEGLQVSLDDVGEEVPAPKTEFNEYGVDAYGNVQGGPESELYAFERSFLEDLGEKSEVAMYHMVSFLLPRGTVNLSSLSKTMRQRMFRAPLFLDYLKVLGQTDQGQNTLVPRVMRLPDLESILREITIAGTTARKWTVGGLLINISDLSTLFRLLEPRVLQTIGIINNHISSIALLQTCTNLRHLELHHCGRIEDLGPLRQLNALEHLQLLKCTGLRSVEPLRGLPRLNLLLLYECPALSNIEAIRSLASLENLGIHSCPLITSYACLQDLEKLKVVEITHSRNLTNVHCLRKSIELSHLDLSGCEQLSDISTLKACGRNLESIKLSGCQLVRSIDALSGCTKLKGLWLNYLEELTDLTPLRRSIKLSELRLRNCAKATGLHALTKVVPNLQYLSLDGCRALVKKDAKAVLRSKRLLEIDVRGTRPVFLVPLLAASDFQLRKAARMAVIVHANRMREYDETLRQELIPKLFALVRWEAPEDEKRDIVFGELREISKESKQVSKVLVSVGTVEKLLGFLQNTAIPFENKVHAVGLLQFLIAHTADGIETIHRQAGARIFLDMAMQSCAEPTTATSISALTIAALAVVVEIMTRTTGEEKTKQLYELIQGSGLLPWLKGFLRPEVDVEAQSHVFGIYILSYAILSVDLSKDLLDTILAGLASWSRGVKKLSAQLMALFLKAEQNRLGNSSVQDRPIEQRVVTGSAAVIALLKELMEDPKNSGENLSAAGLVFVLPESLNAKLVEDEIVLYMLVRLDSFSSVIQRELIGARPHITALHSLLRSLRRVLSDDATADMIAESVEFFARVMPKILFLAAANLPHELYLAAGELLLEGLKRSNKFKSKVQSVYKTKPIGDTFKLFTLCRGDNEEEEQYVSLQILDHLYASPEVLDNLSDAQAEEVTDFVTHISDYLFKGFDPEVVAIAASVVAKTVAAEDPADRVMVGMVLPLIANAKRWDSEDFAKEPVSSAPVVEAEHERLRSALSELLSQFGPPGLAPTLTLPQPLQATQEPTEEDLEEKARRQLQRRRDKVGMSALFLAALISNPYGASVIGAIDQELLEALFHFLQGSERAEAVYAHEAIISLYAAVLLCLERPLEVVLYKGKLDALEVDRLDDDEEKQGEAHEQDGIQEEEQGQDENEQSGDIADLVLRGLTERLRQIEQSEQARNEEIQAQEQVRFLQRQRKLMQLEKVSASLRGAGPAQSQGAVATEEFAQKQKMVLSTLLGDEEDDYPRLHDILDVTVLISMDYSSPRSGTSALQLLRLLCIHNPAFDTALATHGDFLKHLELYLQEPDEDFVVAFFALATALGKGHAELVVNRVIDPLSETILNGSDKSKERAITTVHSFVSMTQAHATAQTTEQPSVRTLVADTTIGQSVLVFLSSHPNRNVPVLATAAATIKIIVADQASVLAGLLRAVPPKAATDFVRLIVKPGEGEQESSARLMEMLNNVLASSSAEDVESLAEILVKNGILEIVESWAVEPEAETEPETDATGAQVQSKTDSVLTVINIVLHSSDTTVSDKIKNEQVAGKLAKLLLQKPDNKYARALTRINPDLANDDSEAFTTLFTPFEMFQGAMQAETEVSTRQKSDDDVVMARVRGLPREVDVDRRYNMRFGQTWTTVAVAETFEFSQPLVYFEVEVVDSLEGATGRIGWISKDFASGVLSGDLGIGIGGDDESWGYSSDGRVWAHGEPSLPVGEAWEDEDVVGICVDLESGSIEYSLNGVFLGKDNTAFDREKQIKGLRPAVSGKGFECVVNLGNKPFHHSPVTKDYVSFSNAITQAGNE